MLDKGHSVVRHFEKSKYYEALHRNNALDAIGANDEATALEDGSWSDVPEVEDAPPEADSEHGGSTPGKDLEVEDAPPEADSDHGGSTPGKDLVPLSPPPESPPLPRDESSNEHEEVEPDQELFIIRHTAGLLNLDMGIGKTMHYGCCALTMKSMLAGYQWQASCPWHRRTESTGCKSHWSLPFDASPEDHANSVRKLMWWLLAAGAYTRQRHHRLLRPSLDGVPADAVLEARTPHEKPAVPPQTDVALDAAQGCGGRGARGGRGAVGRGGGRGRGVGGRSTARSTVGPGSSSNGPDSSDSEQMRAHGLEPKAKSANPPTPTSSRNSDSDSNDSNESNSDAS